MKRHLVVGVPLALALVIGGALVVGGGVAGATHGKKGYAVPVKGDRAGALKRAFADVSRLEKWVDHYCRADCDRPLETIEALRNELELLRMVETTKHTYRPAAMSGPAFENLFRIAHETAYDSRRIELLRVEARTAWFSAAQVRRLLEILDYDSRRLEALEALAPRIVDHENRIVILSVFDYDSSRSRAHVILAGVTATTTVTVPSPW